MNLFDAISEKRLTNYLIWAGGNKSEAIGLYTLNVVISQSFYPITNMVEVALRNSVNEKLSSHFGESWFSELNIKFVDNRQETKVSAIINNFNNKLKRNETLNDHVIPRLTLFYWTNLFSPINKHLWEKYLYSIFKKESKSHRAKIFKILESTRRLRNRIAHLEPIINGDLIFQFENCRELVALISDDAALWCDATSEFMSVHPKHHIIFENYKHPELDLTPWLVAQS